LVSNRKEGSDPRGRVHDLGERKKKKRKKNPHLYVAVASDEAILTEIMCRKDGRSNEGTR
jgi:hypothetical protein